LAKKHAQGVDVASRVDVDGPHLGLFGAHVFERADDLAEVREQRFLGEVLIDRLGHAEIDHLGDRLAVIEGDLVRFCRLPLPNRAKLCKFPEIGACEGIDRAAKG
jgi:hypothetical protein